MPTILNIETSTDVCSVTLSKGNQILVEKICYKPQNHAIELPVYLKEIVTFARYNRLTFDAVGVSSGPGSYTGLRIGVSSAKGISYALGIPIIAIDTLQIIAKEASRNRDEVLFCPMIDARRMEVYTAIYNKNMERQTAIEAKIIDENSFDDLIKNNKLLFCGNGASKCKDIITNKNAIFLDNINPLSTNMVELSVMKFTAGKFEDSAYFEPFYLKEFVATKPKSIF